jgi:DNA repair protein RecO
MAWEKLEGILLHSISYLDSHCILKVFTAQAGLLTLMAKNIRCVNPAVATPFCRSEWIFYKSKGEIYSLREGSLLDPMLHLKTDYRILTAAGSIANDLLQSQMPHRPARALYDLVLATFAHLPQNPNAIAQSFRLKLLQYEGLIHIRSICNCCSEPATRFWRGECFCEKHGSEEFYSFTALEWRQLHTLAFARRFSELKSIELPSSFSEKIHQIFLAQVHQM